MAVVALGFNPAQAVGQVVVVVLLVIVLFTPVALAQADKATLVGKAHTSPEVGKVAVVAVEQVHLELMHQAV